MLKMKQYIYGCLCLLALLLTACNNERDSLVPTGMLYLNVGADQTVMTKAEVAVTNEKLKVYIINSEEDTTTYSDYISDLRNKKLVLPAGTYKIAVSSNQSQDAAWETPFYSGETEVEVKAGEITNAKVVCRIANTKVSVTYSEEMLQYFIDYETNVSNSSGSLLYLRDEYRAGFFAAETLTARLKLVNKDGQEFHLQQSIKDIEPRYHYKLSYSLGNPNPGDGDNAGADFDITIDKSAEEVNYTIYIKEESLFGSGKPYAASKGFIDGVYIYKESETPEELKANTIQLDYAIGTKRQLTSFEIKTTSPDFVKAGLGIFDLKKEDDAQRAAAIGFPSLPSTAIKQDDSYKSYSLDLTPLITKLHSVDKKPTEHPFFITVTDDYGQAVTASFTIKIMPDVAAFVSSPLRWSTFAVLQGNCSDESSYFKLTIGDDEPIDIKDVTHNKTDGNLSALVIGLKPGTTYSYTIASTDNPTMTCESESFTVITPVSVYNLSFEKWGTRSGSAPVVGTKTYVSPNADSDPVYWDSGNLGAAAAGETLTDKTENVATSSSTKAAVLSSKYPSVIGIGAFAAGSIYAGKVKSVTSSGATLEYGQSYQGYPTRLRGYYKYTSGKINNLDSKCPDKDVKKNDDDQCHIYIALSTKILEVISTNSSVLPFSKDNEAVFAYGEYIAKTTEDRTKETGKEAPLNNYAPFKITLNYKRNMPKEGPVYIIVVASASKYGDYFTGSTSSVLYVDEFSLEYDYDPAVLINTDFKDMIPVTISEK